MSCGLFPARIDAHAVRFQNDRAARGLQQSHDAFHQRALAVAVGAEQRDRLALAHLERHAMQRAHGAVTRFDAF